MAFGHEKLDVYRTAIEYVGWAYRCREGKRIDPDPDERVKTRETTG